MRGRFYENGPYSCCDRADLHPQPCTCAMPSPTSIADAAAKAGFGPVPQRIEITADFCQRPACKGARHEP